MANKYNPIGRQALQQLCNMMGLHRPGVLLYFDLLDELELFSDEEVGQLFQAILLYAKTGERKTFADRAMQMVMITQYPKIDADGESWGVQTLQSHFASDCRGFKTPEDKPTFHDWLTKKLSQYNIVDSPPKTNDNRSGMNSIRPIATNDRPATTDDRPLATDHRSVTADTQYTATTSATTSATSTNTTQRDRVTEFEILWQAYPKKVAKETARAAYQLVEAPLADLLEAVQAQQQSAQWQQDGGRFIPELANWLNGKRWHDTLPQAHAGYIRHDDPPTPEMLASIKEMLEEPDYSEVVE